MASISVQKIDTEIRVCAARRHCKIEANLVKQKSPKSSEIAVMFNAVFRTLFHDEEYSTALDHEMFSTACASGNFPVVHQLTLNGFDVNHVWSEGEVHPEFVGMTPAHIAAAFGHIHILSYLVETGVDINIKNKSEFTLLHTAISAGRICVVLFLLSLGAEVHVPNCFNQDPIVTAIYVEELQILNLLAGASNVNLNIRDSIDGAAPLHWAVQCDNRKAVELLIRKGADVNAEMKGGLTPLDVACQMRHTIVVNLLKRAGGKRKVHTGKWVPYCHAILEGNIRSMSNAYDRGVDVNTPVFDGATALHVASLTRWTEVCKFLLRKGANVNQKEATGCTPLHLAVKQGHLNICKMLIDHGARLNATTNEGLTPLLCAVYHDVPDVVKLLADSGADPNERVHISRDKIHSSRLTLVSATAFQLACFLKRTCMIQTLIDAGRVQFNEPLKFGGFDLPGLSVLHLVPSNSYVKCLRTAIEAGVYIDEEVRTYCPVLSLQFGFHFTLQLIEEHSSNCKAVAMCSNTLALFAAVRKGDLNLTKKSYQNGGLVNCCSVKFETPLIYASWKGSLPILKFLLSVGANINLKGPKKSSALHYAAKYDRKNVVIELLKWGASVEEKCFDKTPLQVARLHRNAAIVNILEAVEKWTSVTGRKVSSVKDEAKDSEWSEFIDKVDDPVLKDDLRLVFGAPNKMLILPRL